MFPIQHLYFLTSRSTFNFFYPAVLLEHSRYPLNTSIYQINLLEEKLISGFHFKNKEETNILGLNKCQDLPPCKKYIQSWAHFHDIYNGKVKPLSISFNHIQSPVLTEVKT